MQEDVAESKSNRTAHAANLNMNDPSVTSNPAEQVSDHVPLWKFALHCRGHGGQRGVRANCKDRFREHLLLKLLDVHRSFVNHAVGAPEQAPRNWTYNVLKRICEWPQMFP